jgi:hypothetical protein
MEETMSTLIVTLTHERSTKGTHFYATRDTDAAIGSLYIQKSALPVAPKEIRVTVETD